MAPIDDSAAVPLAGDTVDVLTDRLLEGDEKAAYELVRTVLGPDASRGDVHIHLLGPALREVGERWVAGTISVADEHRATSVAARIVGRLGADFEQPEDVRGTVLVAAVEGDRHGLPVWFVSDILRDRGFDVLDVGADVPAEALIATIPLPHLGAVRVDAVALCVTVRKNRAVKSSIAKIRSARPGVPILLGGAAVADEKAARRLGADAWTGPTGLDAADTIEAMVLARRGGPA